MQIREIMSTGVVTIEPREAASAAWARMRRRGIRHLVVVDEGRVVGVLSERDLGGRSGAAQRKNRIVRELMTPRVETMESEASADSAAELMRERLIGSLLTRPSPQNIASGWKHWSPSVLCQSRCPTRARSRSTNGMRRGPIARATRV